jgi:hypothetical protein
METQAYPSKITMLQDLEKRVEGLDLNTSAFAPRFSFATLAGDFFNCPNAMTFVNDFNKAFGAILDINGCRTTGGGRGKCILTFLDKEVAKAEAAPTEVTTEVVEEVVEETILALADEVVEEVVETILETASEEDTAPKLDLEYATSLQEGKSKTKAKLALEEYGRTLNVELNRQRTFDNMIIDLQEAL